MEESGLGIQAMGGAVEQQPGSEKHSTCISDHALRTDVTAFDQGDAFSSSEQVGACNASPFCGARKHLSHITSKQTWVGSNKGSYVPGTWAWKL